MNKNNDPREHRDFPCTDDAGDGFGNSKWEISELLSNQRDPNEEEMSDEFILDFDDGSFGQADF